MPGEHDNTPFTFTPIRHDANIDAADYIEEDVNTYT